MSTIAASTEYFKPLLPNQSFLKQKGECNQYLADKQKAKEWRNNLLAPIEKKNKKIKTKSQQITLF